MFIPTRKLLLPLALILGCGGCGGLFGGPGPDGAQAPLVPQCTESETLALGGGVYSFRHGLYSTMFIVGKGGVVAVDPLGTEAGCLDQAIRNTAPGLTVQHVIYSHGHENHIAYAGKLPLSPDVRVYAHRQAVANLLRQGPQVAGGAVLPVTDPLDVGPEDMGQPLLLNLLGKRIAIYYFGPTSSAGNLLIHLPDDGVAMLVDVLIKDSVPGTVLASMSPQAVLRTLTRLDRLPFQHLVVGHGPPATHDDVSLALGFWTTYISRTQSALLEAPPQVDDNALDGAPLLQILPQLPVQRVVDGLRPDYGGRIGFDGWGRNGFSFAYLFILSESGQAVPLRAGNQPVQPTRWEMVAPGAYYAQVGAYGSLVVDPDPDHPQSGAPLLVVDPLGENAAILRDMVNRNLKGRSIGHIIYSHAHNDHIANASALCGGLLGGVHIYAHENAARDLRERQNPSVTPPTDVVTGQGMDLKVGQRLVQLRWFGPSHSDGDLVIYLPDAHLAMGVGLVQKGALPGLLAVETDPAGLYTTLSEMGKLDAALYLTGQGGWMNRDEFLKSVAATRDLLLGAASAMKQSADPMAVLLDTPVAPRLRGFVDSVGGTVARSLAQSYPKLQAPADISGSLGELGVTYCGAQSPSAKDCMVR